VAMNGLERSGEEIIFTNIHQEACKGTVWHSEARHGEEIIFTRKGGNNMKSVEVEITGTTPLIMNKPEEYGFDEEWVEKKAGNEWEKEAFKKLYVNADGIIYQPATHIERAMIEAGKKIRIKGQGKANYSKLFGSMLAVPQLDIPHKIDKWEVFKALVVIPSTKGRVMRYRPMFKKWKLKFDMEFEDEISAPVVKEALEIAGRYVGIGDWRPEKKGKFGKFQVTKFKVNAEM